MQYFGTDGIRAQVGSEVMSPEFLLRLGYAAGQVLAGEHQHVLLGKDTRLSGYMIEAALQAGLLAAGVRVGLLGPIPTPAVAYLVNHVKADAGVVISASHNVFSDNGVKFFGAGGKKLTEQQELAIEAALKQPLTVAEATAIGKAYRVNEAHEAYLDHCLRYFPIDLTGMKIVIDCAHGATYRIAPHVFSSLGAHVVAVANTPNGININEACGSVYPKQLQQRVLAEGAQLGIAFDGDGDRVIMVDDHGDLLSGDHLLYILATALNEDELAPSTVVGTIMTNMGLEQALAKHNIKLIRTQVGDKHVLNALQAGESHLGGEPSGHLIQLDKMQTGDGLVNALSIVQKMRQHHSSLRALCKDLHLFDQILVNVKVADPVKTANHALVKECVEQHLAALQNNGRIVLRPSGTEPVVRIMVEGSQRDVIEMIAKDLQHAVLEAQQMH